MVDESAVREQRADLWFVVAVFLISAVGLMMSLQLPPSRFDPMGPGAFPIGICTCLLLLSGVGIVKSATGRTLGRAETSLVLGVNEETEHRRHPWLAVILLCSVVAYALVLQFTPVPFFWATAGFLALAMAALGRQWHWRPLVLSAVIGAVASGALTYVFSQLLVVALP